MAPVTKIRMGLGVFGVLGLLNALLRPVVDVRIRCCRTKTNQYVIQPVEGFNKGIKYDGYVNGTFLKTHDDFSDYFDSAGY